MGRLDELDLSKSLTRKEEARALDRAWERLAQLRLTLGGSDRRRARSGRPSACVFEGWDASGKGGAIKRLVSPRWTRGTSGWSSLRAPTRGREAPPLPVAVLPHSCPGGAGWPSSTAPGTGGCWSSGSRASPPREQWLRAYDEINSFERTLADEGMILVKFWLHISEQEQLKRFERRRDDPLKVWKLTDEDWRNREKRGEYERGGRGHARTDRPAVRARGA